MELDRVAVSRELLLVKGGLLFSPDFHDSRADALSLTIWMHDSVGVLNNQVSVRYRVGQSNMLCADARGHEHVRVYG